MGNDIEIRVSVANQTATGLTAVNNSLRRLRDEARDAGHGLDGLATRAAATTVALRALKDSAQDAARALRSLNTAARNADGRLTTMSDRSRTLRSDTDDLDASMRRLTGTMGDLRGNAGSLNFNASGNGMDNLRKAALTLAPALIPIAASAVPIAVNLGAAGVAIGAFGLAMMGQIGAVNDAATAQGKYTSAVAKHGPASKQAAEAEQQYLEMLDGMDPATRKAAASLSVLKDQYKGWSKSLAGDTMPVFTKGLAVAGALFPKLTPMVKGASTQLDRFMTILGGGISSGGFSKFMESFAKFSTGALSKANDGLVHFMRAMSGGTGSGQLSKFMDYVRKAGPQVGDTLLHLSEALVHVVAAASDTGLSMLTFVNSIAKLVNAIPTGVLSTFLQFAVALKAVKLAAAGMAALGGLSSVATAIGAMRTAAAGASGPLASLSAAFGALSRSAKVALVGTGIGLLVIAMSSLSNIGKKAPPDIDRMSTAIAKLGDTGKVTGEAARVFGKDLSGLGDSLRELSRPSNLGKTQQFLTSLVGMDSTPVKEAKENLDSVDKALAGLVKGGKADLAKVAFNDIAKAMEKQGLSSKELKGKLDDYKSALADQALEAKLTAESQGLFGQAAQDTSAKLDAQKASADGLRGAIQALNDVNRAGLGGMIGFEAAIDAAAEAAKKNHGALSMTNGVLNLHSSKAQAAATALQDLADKTDSAASSQREAGASWETVNGIYSRGRTALIKNAQAMGLSKTEAAALADQIMKIPNKTARVKMNKEDATRDLNSFNAAVKKAPGSKSVTLKTLSKGAEAILESFGLKVKRLPNGKVTVSAKTGGALSGISNVKGAVNSLHGKTITITTRYVNSLAKPGQSVHDAVGATGGLFTGRSFKHGYADGGRVSGPGNGTSDDVFAPWLSNGEFVMKEASVRKYGEKFMQDLNEGRLVMPRFAKGGKVSKQAKAEAQARHDASSDLTISHFGHIGGYQRSEFGSALAKPDSLSSLINSLNQWRGIIKAATHGGQERTLLRALDSSGRKLLSWEKQLTKVSASLEKAKDKLNDLKSSASQLSDSVKSNIISSGNITKTASGDGPVTLASVRAGLTASRDKASAFSGALASLKKKGLSSTLLQQIAEAGIEGGGLETAGALMGASSSEIKSLNSLQTQIGKSATSAGKTTADSVYGKAIAMQEKTVKSLQHSQDKLKASMDRLTKSMEKMIERAFGRKAAGGIVGAAASGGMRGGLTWVGEHEPELLDLPVGSRVWSGPDSRRKAQAPWASMLNTPRGHSGSVGVGTTAGAPGHGSQPVVINVDIAGQHFGQIWVDVGRKEVRARGGLKATLGASE